MFETEQDVFTVLFRETWRRNSRVREIDPLVGLKSSTIADRDFVDVTILFNGFSSYQSVVEKNTDSILKVINEMLIHGWDEIVLVFGIILVLGGFRQLKGIKEGKEYTIPSDDLK